MLSGVLFLASCGDGASTTTEATENVEVGNKTTIVVNPVYDAGEVVKGEIITGIFTVKNTGKYPLVVSEVKGSCTCTVAEKPEKPIPPGSEAVIKAEVDTEKVDVKFEKNETGSDFDLDSKKLDVHVKKDEAGTVVEVNAENGFLKKIGNLIAKIFVRKLNK